MIGDALSVIGLLVLAPVLVVAVAAAAFGDAPLRRWYARLRGRPEPEAAPVTEPEVSAALATEPEAAQAASDPIQDIAGDVRKILAWVRFLGILAIVGMIGGCVAGMVAALG